MMLRTVHESHANKHGCCHNSAAIEAPSEQIAESGDGLPEMGEGLCNIR